ncbi:MAG: hypothetical protein ACOC2H_05080 [Spirochaetota bacterium]
MRQFITYICTLCGRTSRITDGEPIPVCCGHLMRRFDDDAPPLRKTDDDDDSSIDSVLK